MDASAAPALTLTDPSRLMRLFGITIRSNGAHQRMHLQLQGPRSLEGKGDLAFPAAEPPVPTSPAGQAECVLGAAGVRFPETQCAPC
jgi:hypothetical protein